MAATQIEEKLFSDVKADVNRLFNLENTQLQQQDQLAVAQGNIALNLINVYRALGGGWELRLQGDGLSGASITNTTTHPMPSGGPPAHGPFAVPRERPAAPRFRAACQRPFRCVTPVRLSLPCRGPEELDE